MHAAVCTPPTWQVNLSQNQLCGLDRFGNGTYTAEGIIAIADALRVSASVTSVDVGYNSIGKEIALELISIFKQKPMVSVGLAQCGLGPEGAPAVADMIRVIPSITAVLPDKEIRVWTHLSQQFSHVHTVDQPLEQPALWALS